MRIRTALILSGVALAIAPVAVAQNDWPAYGRDPGARRKLPANSYANPITYQGKDGKQYVVIAAQESMVAFRLP